jgi:hypothetical protein
MRQFLQRRCDTLRSCFEGVFWVLFAGFGFVLSFSFDQPIPTYSLGAASWPRFVLLGLTLLGIILILSPQPRLPNKNKLTVSDDSFQFFSRTTWNRLLVFLLPLLYAWLMNVLGFLLVTPFFLAMQIYFFGYRRPILITAVVCAFYLLVVIIFVRLTFIPFPPGVGYFNTLNNQYIEWVIYLGRKD